MLVIPDTNGDPNPKDNTNETEPPLDTMEEDNKDSLIKKEKYFTLCRLLYEGSMIAMKEVFDTIHPPISLKSRLSKVQIVKTLRRLQQQGIVIPEQWVQLYPGEKQIAVSSNFDTKLLQLLLQFVCHLSPPYPNGWEGMPMEKDHSLSADLVRLDFFRKSILQIEDEIIDAEQFKVNKDNLMDILTRIGGPMVTIKAENTIPIKEEEMPSFREKILKWEKYRARVIKADKEDNDEDLPGGFKNEFILPEITTTEVPEDTHNLEETQNVQAERGILDLQRQARSGSLNVMASRTPSRLSSSGRLNEMLRQDKTILAEHHKLITENIRSDIVLSRLVMDGFISHEEKNSINLSTRNVDRMKALLKILPKKPRGVFNAFCDSIKFKNVSIYEQLMKAKKIAMEKPDEITEANMDLISSYQSGLSRKSPVSWHPNANIDVRDFYTPLYITDYHGTEYAPAEIFDTRTKPRPGLGRRIMLEGESGSGKSTVCRFIATEWANNGLPNAEDFKLVYYVDVKMVKNSLIQTMLENNHDESFVKSPRELLSLIDSKQSKVLFMLDSLEDLSPKVKDEVMALIEGKLFPMSTVLVTLNTMYVASSISRLFDTKLVLMGLSPSYREEFVRRYSKITDTNEDLYVNLMEKLDYSQNKGCPILRVLAQNPQLCMCMCLIAETGMPVDVESSTSLLKAFTQALYRLYCDKNKLKQEEPKESSLFQTLTQDMEEMAWRCMHQNGSFYMHAQQEDTTTQNPMFDFGIIEQRTSSSLVTVQQTYFINRVFQDFMAASVLCKLDDEDFAEHLDDLINDKYYHNVTKYLCGLLKDDDDNTDRLTTIMNKLAQINLTKWRGQTVTPHGAEGITTGVTKGNTTPSGIMEGSVLDFKLSLGCLNECENREDVAQIISESLPERLFIPQKMTLTQGIVMGLAKAFQRKESRIAELELRLDHYASYHEEAFYVLGKSVNQSNAMRVLTLHWLDAELLTGCLAHIFSAQCRLQSLVCKSLTNSSMENKVSARAWANMTRATKHMTPVENVSFTQCQNKTMVTCILHNVPYTVKNLDLSCCTLDNVSAQELKNRIEKACEFNSLDLTSVTIHAIDFGHICSGLKMSRGLKELIIRNTQLELLALVSLAETLGFNHTLVHLDICNNELPVSVCRALVKSMKKNNYLKKLSINGAKMTKEGKTILSNTTGLNVAMFGMDQVKFKISTSRLSKESTTILEKL